MKLLVCDVEGTIFQAKYKIDGTDYASTMWQPIAGLLGETAVERERKTHQDWENSHYQTYLDWVKDSIRIHKEFGLRESDFNTLIEQAEYCDGVLEFFSSLDREKYIPVLISGGFQNLSDRAQKDLKIDHSFGACRYLFDEEGYLETWNLYASDFKNKYDHVELLIKQYGLNSKKDWIFIGDGKNDKYIAAKAPLAIAFGKNAHPEMVEKCYAKITNFNELNNILESFEAGIITDKVEATAPKTDQSNNKIKEFDSYTNMLIKERDDEKKYNAKLVKENNELKAKVYGSQQKKEYEEKSYESDFFQEPTINLEKILEDHKIGFVGMKHGQSNYFALEKLHKNLIVIPGDVNRFDKSILNSCEFIFIFISSIGHSTVAHLESKLKNTPHSFINFDKREVELLKKAMANILCRYWRM